MAERQGLEPRTPWLGATVFKTASSTDRTRSLFGKRLPSVDLHHDDPVNSRACCFDMTGDGPSARFRAAVIRLSSGCSAIELRRMGMKMVARPGAAPGICRRGGQAGCASRNRGLRFAQCFPRPKRGGLLSPSRAILTLAACAGIAPATFCSTGGGSSWLS